MPHTTTSEASQPGQNLHRHDVPHVGTWRYVWGARLGVALSAPLIYACLFPMALLDLFVSLYQTVCFAIYGIPKVRRADHFVFDRGRLRYLNWLERLNCVYCSHANGLAAYFTEIAARTEQHWCPVKHSRAPATPHSRYAGFLPFADPRTYAEKIEQVRRDFRDLEDRSG
jgi:hypothetical protein